MHTQWTLLQVILTKGNTINVPRVASGKKMTNSGHKLMDASGVKDAENSGQYVLQVEIENATKNCLHTKIQLVIGAFVRLAKIILHVVKRMQL